MAMKSSVPGMLLVIAAIAASSTVVSGQSAPTYDEWKESKANASAAADAQVAKQKKMAAVDKVMELLEGLKTQVLEEGEKEAATYNSFSCFCKDTTTERLAAIKKGEDDKTALSAGIQALETKRGTLDTSIKTLTDDIELAKEATEQASDARSKELKVYTANAADLQLALDALAGAIKSLKGSRAPSLAQFQGVAKTIRTAALLADALGIGNEATQSTASFFLQQPANKVQMEDYKFHSEGIITTLEKLLADFRAKKVDVDKDEVSAVSTHEIFMQEKKDLVKTKQEELAQAQERKATTQDEISTKSQERTTVAATLLDDQEYVKELDQMCREKAQTWDQRSDIRANELSTLTQVIAIIGGAVTNKTTAATVRLAQQGMSVRLANAVAGNEAAMEAVEAEAEAVEATQAGAPLAFVQRHQGKPRSFLAQRRAEGPREEAAKKAVAELLRRSGVTLKSATLASLASKINADPFAKVKQLIQELIERLLTQAGNEANHKGWCDTSISDAEQKRDYAAEKIKQLDGEMANLEALRDKLAEELKVLGSEIGKIESAQAEAQKLRGEEKAENANTVQEAQEGVKALKMAMDIVSKFYKTVAKEQVTYALAQGPMDDAPDAGFANGEAYTGAQSEAGGILGMMEVMESDFQRTIAETEAAEAQAEQEHLVFMTESGKSLAQKNQAKTERTTQKGNAEDKLATADDGLSAQTSILKTAIKELLELKPVCIDTGMTYAERVARRRDEIEALKKALCILGAYAEYGPEGAADSC